MAGLDEHVTKSNDPKLVAARLFVGNLPSDRTNKEELARIFEKCGKVIGVSINSKGYGFVQYETEAAARRGAKELNKASLNGSYLDVKLASVGKKSSLESGSGLRKRRWDEDYQRQDETNRDRDERHFRSTRPSLTSDTSLTNQFPLRPPPFNELPMMQHGLPATAFMAQPPPSNGPTFQSEKFRNDMFSSLTGPPKPPVPPVPPMTATPHEDTPNSAKKPEPGVERPFDAVIVVTQKSLKHYAELVERRLLELNMVVDMIFLLNEKALNKAIDDMTRRGVLYIIVVQVQHEEHKSITVNIMHGSPQEHRNMPLEDALIMLARNFNSYLSSLRCGSEQPTMGFLLNLLAEGKHLSVAELDRIIAHLQDRRDRLIETEGGRKDSSSSTSTVALQQKILSLVSSALLSNNNPPAGTTQTNKSAPPAAGPGQPPAAAMANLAQQFGINFNSRMPPPSMAHQMSSQNAPIGQQTHVSASLNENSGSVRPPLNFSDPNLIKALDNLMQSPSLFKTMNPPLLPMTQRHPPPLPTSIGQSFAMPPPPATMGFRPNFG